MSDTTHEGDLNIRAHLSDELSSEIESIASRRGLTVREVLQEGLGHEAHLLGRMSVDLAQNSPEQNDLEG